jgi:hypothetical protein
MPNLDKQRRLSGAQPSRCAAPSRGNRPTLRGAFGTSLLFAVAFEGSACAMSPADKPAVNCTVENLEKLPAGLRQQEAVCGPLGRAVEAAAAKAALAPGAVTLRVVVDSQYKLAATATVNGTALPEQKLGSSDRPLTTGSIEMLASAVAAQLAEFGAK